MCPLNGSSLRMRPSQRATGLINTLSTLPLFDGRCSQEIRCRLQISMRSASGKPAQASFKFLTPIAPEMERLLVGVVGL